MRHCRELVTVLAFALAVGASLAGSAVVSAGQATPTVEPAGSLAEMLAMAPDLSVGADQPGVQLAEFADSAAQMAAVGVETPVPGDNDGLSYWLWANWWMPFPDPLRSHALDERWPELFGFDATQVDRSLVVGEPPFTVAIYQGRFDEAALRKAWEASGYQPVELPDAPDALVYSISEDESIDFANEAQLLALANMNNLALLPDGTLIAATRLDNLERTLATIRGEAPSLLDRPDVATLVAAGDPGLVAAYLVTGEALQAVGPGNAGDRLSEEQAAAVATAAAEEAARVGVMPAPELALIGLTAGGPLVNVPTNEAGTPEPFRDDPPLARFVLSLLFPDRATAEAAIPVVESRLSNGTSLASARPFTEYFASWEIDVASDAPVLLLDLTYVGGTPPDIAIHMFFRRDLGFVAWSIDPSD